MIWTNICLSLQRRKDYYKKDYFRVMILVTGGTGLVGAHLLYQLCLSHDHIRATYRKPQKLEETHRVFSYYTKNSSELFSKIEWVKADITNIPELEDTFLKITQVYHCAALVTFEPDKYFDLRKTNIEGTANIVNLCIENQIDKLCYVSSIAALGEETNPKTPISETSEWNTDKDHNVYAISKHGAELEVWRGTQEGLNAIIVNPGVIIGVGFWNHGGSASLFKKAFKGISHYSMGNTGFIDVADLTKIMVYLMKNSPPNENYICISSHLTFKAFFDLLCVELGKRVPKRKASTSLLEIGWRLDWLNNKIFGKRRQLSKQLARSLNQTTYYDNSKLKSIIPFELTNIKESISSNCKHYLEDNN